MSKAGSGFDVCGGCRKSYRRLSTHIAQNASCANQNTQRHRVHNTSSVATTTNSRPPTNTSPLFVPAFNQHSSYLGRKHQHSSSSSGRKQAPFHEKEKLNDVPSDNIDDEFPPFDDQTASDIDDDRLETDEEEVQPDESVLHFYKKLFCIGWRRRPQYP
jgi:hypothetical protein